MRNYKVTKTLNHLKCKDLNLKLQKLHTKKTKTIKKLETYKM